MLTLLWGWVVGPAFALLLTKVLPLAEPHALGLLIFSLAPVAPMVSLLARRARSDMDFTAALIPLAMVATVVLLPLLVPWLMKRLTLNTWALAKPLLLLVLLPLVGVALNGTSSVLYGSVPDLVAPARRQRAFGIFYTGTIGSGAIAPIVFGLVGDALGVPSALIVVAAVVLLTLPITLALRPALAVRPSTS